MQTDTGTDKSDQAAEMDPRHLVGLVEHAKDQEAAVRVHQLRHHPVPPRHGADQAPVEVHHRRRELVCRLRSEPRERPDWDWRSARSERAVLRLCVRRPAGRLLAATGGSNVRDNTRRNQDFLARPFLHTGHNAPRGQGLRNGRSACMRAVVMHLVEEEEVA